MANVFFDVQGTLLTMEEVPRPRAREAFLILKEKGHAVYLWSSGGAGYAATAAELLEVADLVSGYFGKREEPDVPVDFAWTTTRRWWKRTADTASRRSTKTLGTRSC
jgi:hypothetical protein